MTEYIEVPNIIVCHKCKGKNVISRMGTTIDICPPFWPYKCKDCAEEFYDFPYNLVKKES